MPQPPILLFLLFLSLRYIGASPLTPNIPLSRLYDVTLESGRAGNTLMLQDRHSFLQTSPLLLPNSSPTFTSFSVSFYYQHFGAGAPGLNTNIFAYKYDESIDLSSASSLSAAAPILTLLSWSSHTTFITLGQETVDTAIPTLYDGSWHHAFLTWESSSGKIDLYVDSLPVWSGRLAAGLILKSAGYLTIGQLNLETMPFGLLDDFFFFTTNQLSQSDRLALSTPTASMPLSSLLATSLSHLTPTIYYSFNQARSTSLTSEGQLIQDDSGSGNHARTYSSTHSFAVIVPSTLNAWTTSETTVLFPVTAESTDYTIQLAYSGLGTSSSMYAASSVTITSLPDSSLIKLYRVDSTTGMIGMEVQQNDQLFGSSGGGDSSSSNNTKITIIARASSSFILTSTTSFTYTLTPKNSSLPTIPSTIHIGANSPPLPGPATGYQTYSGQITTPRSGNFTATISVEEGSAFTFLTVYRDYPSLYFYNTDPDGEIPVVWIVEIPTEGVLFQNAQDARTNSNAITNASYSSPVLAHSSTLVYRVPRQQPGSVTQPRVVLILSDGRQLAKDERILVFSITNVPHLPVLQPVAVTVNQDALQLIQLKMDTSLLDQGDWPYITITELPQSGRLFQVNPINSTLGPEILSTGRESPTISQWISHADAWSSYYPSPNDWWSPNQTLGAPNVFPTYGGSTLAWAGLNSNEDEWLELSVEIPVYITGIEIYETDQPGHVRDIYAKHPSSTQDKPIWVLIWHNEHIPTLEQSSAPDLKSVINAPTICPTPFATRSIRIETAAGQGWVEIDAVRVVGVMQTARTDLIDTQQRVYYQAPSYARGQDDFKYSANTCRYYGLNRAVGVLTQSVNITLSRMNHPPLADAVSLTTDAYGSGFFSLQGTDKDGDMIEYRIMSLPEAGEIWIDTNTGGTGGKDVIANSAGINTSGLQHGTSSGDGGVEDAVDVVGPDSPTSVLVTSDMLPLSLPFTTSLRYIATSTCDYSMSGAYENDSFTYVAVDMNGIPPQMTSSTQTVHIQRYCINPKGLSSSVYNFIFFFVAFGVIVCVAIMLFFLYYRCEPIIKASSLLFNLISLVGCIGLCLSLVPLAQTQLNAHWCFARWAVPSISFTLLFSSLFAKTYRIYKIFMNTNLSEKVLSNLDLGKFVAAGVGGVSVILLLYGLISPPKAQLTYTLDEDHGVYGICSTETVFKVLLLTFQGILILVGTFLTILVRNVPSTFNEGAYIGLTIYNALVLGALGIILDFILGDNVQGQIFVRCFLLILGIGVVIGALFCTKVAALWTIWCAVQRAQTFAALRAKLFKKYYTEAIAQGKSSKEATRWADSEIRRHIAAAAAKYAESISDDPMQLQAGYIAQGENAAAGGDVDTNQKEPELLPNKYSIAAIQSFMPSLHNRHNNDKSKSNKSKSKYDSKSKSKAHNQHHHAAAGDKSTPAQSHHPHHHAHATHTVELAPIRTGRQSLALGGGAHHARKPTGSASIAVATPPRAQRSLNPQHAESITHHRHHHHQQAPPLQPVPLLLDHCEEEEKKQKEDCCDCENETSKSVYTPPKSVSNETSAEDPTTKTTTTNPTAASTTTASACTTAATSPAQQHQQLTLVEYEREEEPITPGHHHHHIITIHGDPTHNSDE